MMPKQDESVVTVQYNSEDVLECEINYIDSEGNIKIRNFDANKIHKIPFQNSYCLFVYKNARYLLRCKNITDNRVELYYPLKRICELDSILSFGVSKEDFTTIFQDKEAFEKFQQEQSLSNKPIFSEAIYAINAGINNTFFYVGDDNKPHTIYTGPCNRVRFLNEYYMLLQHITIQENKTNSVIYYFGKDIKQPTKLYDCSSANAIEFEDFNGNIVASVFLCKVGDKRPYYVYGIFEGYKNKFPYEDSSTYIPNAFFSSNDEYKIRDYTVGAIKYESFIILINDKKKRNILMLDGNFMFDKWVDNIRSGDSIINITYTDDNGKTVERYLWFDEFKAHYSKCTQINL